jgi:phosphatidylserine/phosphatidylglycerophosphate/cardiolipin synthase-like enzyme
MASGNFTSVGPGKTLAYLRGDVRAAAKSFFLIGPWLDSYVAEQIVLLAPRTLQARVLVRPEQQVEAEVWQEIVKGLSRFAAHWNQFEARTLERLHAKCVLIDDRLCYVGSANWYRYSVETSLEIVLRGPLDSAPDLQQECEALWERATPFSISKQRTTAAAASDSTGITHEVLDPLAAQVLRDNPKAFVLGKKKRRPT